MNVRHFTAAAAALLLTSAAWAAAPAKPAAPKPAATPQEPGRDWSRIDTNGDGLVSPEEMEKWLAENPGPAKK